jgi:hypothetical protein
MLCVCVVVLKRAQQRGGMFDYGTYVYWTQWLRLALTKGRNRIGVSLPLPEDGNRSSFRNVVFYSYLESQ